MASAFNVPDEFVRGFITSGQSMVQALSGAGISLPAAAAPDSAAVSLAKAQAHYWQQQMALWMGMLASTGELARAADS